VGLASRNRAGPKAIAVIAVSLVVVSCSSGGGSPPGPRIGIPGGQSNDTEFTKRAVSIGQPRTFGALMICSENTTHPILITAIAPLPGATNLAVTDFGTRPNPFLQNKVALGQHVGTAGDLGFRSKSVALCGPPIKGPSGTDGQLASTTELAVTLRSSAPIAETDGFSLSYEIAGAARTFTLYDNLTLCTSAAAKAAPTQCG
jgi:hypothetical protein